MDVRDVIKQKTTYGSVSDRIVKPLGSDLRKLAAVVEKRYEKRQFGKEIN